MEDRKELVERLRAEPMDSRKAAMSIMDLCIDAAKEIETLESLLAESEAARSDLGKRLAAAQQELAAYKDTGMEPEEIKKHEAAYNECLTRTYGPFKQKISQWLQAEQEGRLVVLPQKTVWELTMDAGPDCDMKCPVDAWDESLGCDLCSKAKRFAYERPCTQGLLKELGKTVFLNREEAEAALAGKGGAPSDAPEELVEAEWKNRLMRTFLGGMPEN